VIGQEKKMTVATVIDLPIMRGSIETVNSAIQRFSGSSIFDLGQEVYQIFGALLGAMAMTNVFIIERSTLII
jgi:hypothetical protein